MKKLKPIIFAAFAASLLISCKNNYIPEIKPKQETKQETKTTVPVSDIHIESGESLVSVVKGDEYTIIARAVPNNASDKKLTFSLDKPDIASITDKGVIKAEKPGEAVITIKAADGVQKTVNLIVTPAPVPVNSIEVPSDLPGELYIGDSLALRASVVPDSATNKKLIYHTDNDNVSVTAPGTITARSAGSVNVTITSEGTPTVTKMVTFTIKNRPQIKYESKQAVMVESAAGTYTFELQTIDGKLDYEPCFTSNTLPWISGAPAITSRDDQDKDVISFTCTENKTVWDRRAYIRFWDKKANAYVKGTDDKELTVNIIQKKNENPVVHYKWVYGIEGPKDNEKEKVAIIHNSTPTGEFYQQSYVFKWRESETTKFYNVRKLDKLFVQGTFPGDYYIFTGINGEQKAGKDISQCWAKTASNMLHWWFEHNKDNIDYYVQKSSITPEKRTLYNPKYKRYAYPANDNDRLELDKKENMKSSIANIFRGYAHNDRKGGLIEDGLTWYLYKRDNLNGLSKSNPKLYPALFDDVFDLETSPILIERCETKKEFETQLNAALDNKRAIGVFWEGTKGRQYKHAVTCWGAAYDEDNNIICLYIAESNLLAPVLYPFGVRYEKDIYVENDSSGNPIKNQAYMFNYELSKPENIYIDGFTTLDLGEAQWQKWLAKH